MKKREGDVNNIHSFFTLKSILFLGANIFIFLSCITFQHRFPEKNWLGITGYLTAWLLHYLFGITSYVILAFSFWISIQQLLKKPVKNFKAKLLYFSILVISISILSNLFSEVYSVSNEIIQSHCYSEESKSLLPFPHHFVRYNLGGVPLYYLYKDLPLFNLQHLFSNIGVMITFSLIGFVSSILFTDLYILLLIKNICYGCRDFFKWLSKLSRIFFLKEQNNPIIYSKNNSSFIHPTREEITSVYSTEKPITSRYKSPVLTKTIMSVPEEEPNELLKTAAPVNLKKTKFIKKSPIVKPLHSPSFKKYQLPSEDLISEVKKIDSSHLHKDLQNQATRLEETLASFHIEARVGSIHSGPTITSFEVHPAVGVKVQKIKALENDIALNLQARSIRIIAPIPGKAAVGIEVPSLNPQEVGFREMLIEYQKGKQRFHIPILLGKTVHGENVMCDLTRMPHCIIAGATGSGKSVCINTMIMSIIMNSSPEDTKLILIDPKKVELTPYSPLPHMIAPVITEATEAYAALHWIVKEMQYRYEILKQLGLRNIASFNHRKIDRELEESLPYDIPKKMFYTVCIIDEFADLMMTSSSDLETPIARIAQMARAVGMHLILATQRPSREIITGIIKANFPTRIAFKVSSRVNSQIILDENGAESLLGNGDMLFLPPGSHQLIRAQGVYIRDEDINRIIAHTCRQSPTNYLIKSFDSVNRENFLNDKEETPQDSLYTTAIEIVLDTQTASTTFLQRKLKIGYARAASLMDELESRGIIGPQDGSKPRKILVKKNATHSLPQNENENA